MQNNVLKVKAIALTFEGIVSIQQSEAHSESSQISTMELLAKIVSG